MIDTSEEVLDPSATLDSLLKPFQDVYGEEVVDTAIDIYYRKLNKDKEN